VYTALTAAVVFWWGLRVFGRGAGFLACLLTLLNVNLLLYSLMGTDDTGFAFYFISSLAVLYVALTEERDRCFLLAGVLGGLALLEKPSGFFIPAVFLAPALKLGKTAPWRVAKWLGLLFAPCVAAVGVYLLRNYMAYGSPQFRFGVLVWIWKRDGYEGWTQLFDRVPSLAGMLQEIGWEGAVGLTWVELRRFLRILMPLRVFASASLLLAAVPALMPALALSAALVTARRMPEMAWLFICSLVASAAFCSILYTAQMRYFAWLIPLSALWVSGVLTKGMRCTADRWRGRLVRVGWVAVGGWFVVASGTTLLATQRVMRKVEVPKAAVCRGALDWVVEATAPDERILTFDPWFVNWATDREAIMIPSGGVKPILVVARRYDAHWLLASRSSLRPRTSKVVMAMQATAAEVRVTRRFDDGVCRVYRLDWPPVPESR
jgi:4-amino-4-deoxy-L-arabinose transferase-like glycosyltransferase